MSMKRWSTMAAGVASVAGWATSGWAATLQVPSQFATIQGAISAASNGDVILVAPGTYAEQIDFLGKDIVVRSSGGAAVTTITGGGIAGPVVSLVTGEPATARLEGFRITGGFVEDADGAGVRLVGSSATIADSIITGNQTFGQCTGCEARGGGASVSGGSPVFLRVTFDNNAAFPAAISGIPKGGGLWVGGGATATITDGSFTNNRTLNRNGGGLYLQDGSTVTITGTSFTANYTESGAGGAIFMEDGTLTVTNATFTENYSRFGAAGAISAEAPTRIEVIGSTFHRNNQPATDSELGAVGGIETYGGVLIVRDSTFTDNVAQGGTGGGIFSLDTEVTVSNSTFRGNVAPGGAGAGISVFGSAGGTLLVTGSTFENNDSSGAGIWAESNYAVTVRDSSFTNNIADGGTGGGLSFRRGATFTLEDLTFSGNQAPGGAGAGVVIEGASSGVIRRCTFTGHAAPSGSGAAIAARIALSQSPTVTVEDVSISDSSGGRAIQVTGANVTLRRVLISGSTFGALGLSGTGTLTIEDSSIRGNSGSSSIGSFTGGTFNITNTILEDNDAGGGTSGITVSGSTTGTIARSIFRRNGLDTPSSGTILSTSGTSSTTLVSVLAANNGGSSGGAIRIAGNSSVSLLNSTLADSNNATSGTAILLTSSSLGAPATLIARNSILRGLTTSGRSIIRQTGTNTSVTVDTCNVQGGFVGGINVTTDDPQFTSVALGDYTLLAGSPAIDAGNALLVPPGQTLDLAGGARIQGAGVDLGAYEFVSAACPCNADYDNSGSNIPDIDDLLAFFDDFNNGSDRADLNCTGAGSVPDIEDVLRFFEIFSNGC